jgi:hypothetical protein
MALASQAHGVILDFKIAYYSARCLVQHQDPYNASDVLRLYYAEGGERPPDAPTGYRTQMIVASQVYLPNALFLVAPFGLFSWPLAYGIWSALTICGITAAAVLMWRVASSYAAGPPLYLISFLLLNSGILFAGGNPAGVAISLCVIAAWCFLEDHFVSVGVVCMAVSLALKPHDSGLVWLYFLLAGAVVRKSALKSLLITALIGVAAIACISHISQHWLSEIQQNLQQITLRGSYNDPGPAGKNLGPGGIIALQTVTSVIRDDPAFYNPAAYLICAPLLLYWGYVTIRSRFSQKRAWFALSSIAPLIMLPVYHRPYDAKLLLLAIPACAILSSGGGIRAWLSLALTTLAIVFTSDLPLALLSMLSNGMHIPGGASGAAITILLLRPAPLALLLLAAFNLFQYARICRSDVEDSQVQLPSLSIAAASRK